MVEVLNGAPNADYMLKFVSMPAIRSHVEFFTRYFLDNGIPLKNIKIIDENSNREDTYHVKPEEAPLARKKLEEHTSPASAADAPPEPDAPVDKCCRDTDAGCASNAGGTRLTIADLRTLTRKTAEPAQVAT